MWTGIRLKNFKGYRDMEFTPFRRLTVLIGPNGSGKSSLIQSLLLCKQSAVSIDQSTPLITDGQFVNVGGYKNFVNLGNSSKNIEINLKWMKVQKYGYGVMSHNSNESYNIFTAGDQILSEICVLFGLDKEKSLCVKKLSYRNQDGANVVTARPLIDGKAEFTITKHIISNPFYEPYANELLNFDNETLQKFPFTFKTKWRSKKFYRLPNFGMPRQLAAVFRILEEFFVDEFENQLLKTTYIGPLRERPDRYYFEPHERTPSTDPSGKKTGAALFGDSGTKLIDQSSRWMRELDIAEGIRLVKVSGNDIFSLQITGKGQKYSSNIADFGFGASQILPIIVESLLSDDEACVLIEQPEIHLNAHHQVLLPNFFAEMINTSQKQFIIETHSEYFLKRLGTLVAKKVLKADDVIILYASADADGSHIKPITLDNLGRFSEWPEGFLEEGFEASAEHLQALEAMSEGEENAN